MAGKRSDAVRFQHRVFGFSCSRSLGQLHSEFDDNDDLGSRVFKHLQPGSEYYNGTSMYDHWAVPSVLQYNEHVQWACRSELCLAGKWSDADRFQHRVLDLGGGRSLRQLHSEFDDNDNIGSHMFEQLSGGRDCYPAASVYD